MQKVFNFNIDNSFSDSLPADPNLTNQSRQVHNSAFSYSQPQVPLNPTLISHFETFAAELGLTKEMTSSQEFLNTFSGKSIYPNTKPYAMCYGGHQFGHWAGQLGDGRAHNLFEIQSADHKRWAFQLKGSGLTPYSRTADGKAVLRSSIREYLCSEAMHHLGIPTTRALSLILTGDQVLRDVLYNGNPAYEKGAIVCRVAPSFVRFGNFQIFAAREDFTTLKKLADYTITNFFPELGVPSKEVYVEWFKIICQRTLDMLIHWQRVGFVHGVMNTDNFSILGLTIDYGPYGWLEDYNPQWTPNTTDNREKRYRYENQLNIGLWNLLQLANALFPLVNEAKPFENILAEYQSQSAPKFIHMMTSKLGINKKGASTIELVQELQNQLVSTETDMTIFFRSLSNTLKTDSAFEMFTKIQDSFYGLENIDDSIKLRWLTWFEDYKTAINNSTESDDERQALMNKINPKFVLRNYMAQLAIEKADTGDYSLIDTFKEVLSSPYDSQKHHNQWYSKRPDWARHKIGCSMLSCSS